MVLNFDVNYTHNLEQIINFIQIGYVPEVSTHENNIANCDEVLLAHLNIAKCVLNKLNILLSKLLNNDKNVQTIKSQDILNPCLYLCGEHNRSDFPWSDTESHSLKNSCIEKLCNLMQFSNIEELLTQMDVSKIFIGLQYKLGKDNWKKYPGAIECFIWLLKCLKVRYKWLQFN